MARLRRRACRCVRRHDAATVSMSALAHDLARSMRSEDAFTSSFVIFLSLAFAVVARGLPNGGLGASLRLLGLSLFVRIVAM